MASLAKELIILNENYYTLTLSFSEMTAGVTNASLAMTSLDNLSQIGLVQKTVLLSLSLDLVFDHFMKNIKNFIYLLFCFSSTGF
jgi:hypothetical protein